MKAYLSTVNRDAARTKTVDGEAADASTASSTPLYQMVVRALKAEILSGEHPVGTPLPSESSLVERFSVSRHTVREALRILRDLGLVESRQGVGTLVLKPGGPQVYVHQVSSIGDLHDFRVESRYNDTAERVILDPVFAERLGARPGETWLQINGQRFEHDGEDPICVVEIYIPVAFAAVERLLGCHSGPIYSLIETVYGESIAEVEQQLRACPATPDLAERLCIEPGEALIEIRRHYRLRDGHTAEITLNYYKATNFSFSMKLHRVRSDK